MSTDTGSITAEQYDYLMKPLRSSRVAKRSQGGKQLSYLESWDVRAHLIRIFGFGNFDVEVEDSDLMFVRDYDNNGPKQEIAYKVSVRLTLRNADGTQIATYREAAVGSASGGTGIGDLHDNALKTAASDALKRCAINLGTQYGLSLYNDGQTTDVVRVTLVKPEGVAAPAAATVDQEALIAASLGGVKVEEAS